MTLKILILVITSLYCLIKIFNKGHMTLKILVTNRIFKVYALYHEQNFQGYISPCHDLSNLYAPCHNQYLYSYEQDFQDYMPKDFQDYMYLVMNKIFKVIYTPFQGYKPVVMTFQG